MRGSFPLSGSLYYSELNNFESNQFIKTTTCFKNESVLMILRLCRKQRCFSYFLFNKWNFILLYQCSPNLRGGETRQVNLTFDLNKIIRTARNCRMKINNNKHNAELQRANPGTIVTGWFSIRGRIFPHNAEKGFSLFSSF